MGRKAVDRSPPWRGGRFPTGSENGACAHGGDPGTREGLLPPAMKCRKTRGTGRSRALAFVRYRYRHRGRARQSSCWGHETKDTDAGTGRERGANRPGWEEAVLAEHSTEEGGEVRPKRPAGGKAKPGMASARAEHGRDLELTNCVTDAGADCGVVSRYSDSGSNGHAHVPGYRYVFPDEDGEPRNRMRESRTAGSVGGAGGNPGSYPDRAEKSSGRWKRGREVP